MHVLDIIKLNEFDQGDFVLPEIDVIGPTDPETASINIQNALLLLQLDPDSKAMAEVHKLLAHYHKSAGTDGLQPAIPAQAVPAPQAEPAPVEPAPQADVPQAEPAPVEPAPEADGEDETDEFGNPISEGKKAIDIGSKVALLNENDPEQAELLAKIEAILESKKIEPVIASIVDRKSVV